MILVNPAPAAVSKVMIKIDILNTPVTITKDINAVIDMVM